MRRRATASHSFSSRLSEESPSLEAVDTFQTTMKASREHWMSCRSEAETGDWQDTELEMLSEADEPELHPLKTRQFRMQ